MLQDKIIALEISQLMVNYDKTPVLWDINLSVPKGKMAGIIGRGKKLKRDGIFVNRQPARLTIYTETISKNLVSGRNIHK